MRTRDKLQINVTYNQYGRPLKYTREVSLGTFGHKRVRLEAKFEENQWFTHAVLPPTGDDELYIRINTSKNNTEDSAWGWSTDELYELNKESRLFIEDVEMLNRVEVSVEITEEDSPELKENE